MSECCLTFWNGVNVYLGVQSAACSESHFSDTCSEGRHQHLQNTKMFSFSELTVKITFIHPKQALYLLKPITKLKYFVMYCDLSLAHTVRFWPRFGRLRQILKILKDSYNPRLKSVVFDRWFDIFTAIKFHLRRNSGSVWRFGTLSWSVTSPTMNVKLCLFFKMSYEQN